MVAIRQVTNMVAKVKKIIQVSTFVYAALKEMRNSLFKTVIDWLCLLQDKFSFPSVKQNYTCFFF